MRTGKKWLVRILLIAMLLPSAAMASFYEEPPTPPDNTGTINGALGGNGTTTNPTITRDENGNTNVNIGVNGSVRCDPGGDRVGIPQGTIFGCITPTVYVKLGDVWDLSGKNGSQSSGSNSAYAVSNPQQLLDFIHVQTAPGVKDDLANKQKIIDGLNDQLQIEGGVAALIVPTQVNQTVVEKTIALGTPAGLYVSQDAFTANSSQLTSAGIQFFNQIKLYGGDIAAVIGSADRINLIKTQLLANGATNRQVLLAPAANMKNPNTVAVYIIRLPTMADLLAPASNGDN